MLPEEESPIYRLVTAVYVPVKLATEVDEKTILPLSLLKVGVI